MTTVAYHSHTGFYDDGNSHYESVDTLVHVPTNTVRTVKVESWGGQLAGDHQFARTTKSICSYREAVPFTIDDLAMILEALEPMIKLAAKYPHRNVFTIFSKKQYYFYISRINKAKKVAVAAKSDYYGTNCGKHVFILGDSVVSISIGSDSPTTTYQFYISVTPLVEALELEEVAAV